MVGIVIVSHSRKLAEGVLELAQQMSQGQCSLAIAGGIDDDEHPIGTDAIKVMDAIEQVYDDSGVLMLMDMGSALLSTETALDLIDPDMAANVVLCSAPLVEGTIAATVAASAGLSLNEVVAEAKTALSAKQDQLGEGCLNSDAPQQIEQSGELEAVWVLQNPHGLHARPAASLVTALAGFDIQGWLIKGDKTATIRSLNNIAALGVRCGDEIKLRVSGSEASQAIYAFQQLAQNHFNENIHTSSQLAVPEGSKEISGALCGLPVCEGVVFGAVKHFVPVLPKLPSRDFTNVDDELLSFTQACDRTLEDLEKIELDGFGKLGTGQAHIFKAHVLMLRDPELQERVHNLIKQGQCAEHAWMQEIGSLSNQYEKSESEYMRQRATDIVDVGRRLLSHLLGEKLPTLQLDSPVILLAEDLTPSDTANLDPKKVLALCLSKGSRTSHSAILARALGIPAVVQVDNCLDKTHDGQKIILDGFHGRLWLEADPETITELEQQRKSWLVQLEQNQAVTLEVAKTKDGFQPDVMANISKPEDVDDLIKSGAQGVGLLRTEFLFLDRDLLPDEDEQYQIYSDIAARLNGHPLTIRTLDIGGDKPLPSIQSEQEANPFLGCRGIRLCLAQPELFKTQLRAIVRAAKKHSNIQVMFPMISTVGELRQAKAILQQCQMDLGMILPNLQVGIMVEVPAAVFNADDLAQDADFFSIGTNDLTQYVMAADRGNARVSDLVDYKQPAVLQAISATCHAAIKAGIPVGMCGEMAGDPEMTALLLELGVTKFSASPTCIPALKASIRNTDLAISSIR